MAELQFDPQTGIVVPEVSEVREDIGKAVQDAFQTDPNDRGKKLRSSKDC